MKDLKKNLFLLVLIQLSIQASFARSYYISMNGSDQHSGLSREQAWASLEKINTFKFSPGDTIRFRKGDCWYGQLCIQSGGKDRQILYTTYGKGNKPSIFGSISRNKPSDWQKSSNYLWVSSEPLNKEIGNILINNADLIGKKKWEKEECSHDLDFYYEEGTKRLFLYCKENPAIKYSSIQCAQNQTIVELIDVQYTVIEDLHLLNGGGHGIQMIGCSNIIVRGCEIEWIGGGKCPGLLQVRYGNAIEIWGNATNILIERNIIFNIYDTALTNQNHSKEGFQEYITYRNNECKDCGMYTFEVWNNGGGNSTLKEIIFENNISINPGQGWGMQRPDQVGFHFNLGNSNAHAESIKIINNTMKGGNGILLGHFFQKMIPEWFSAVMIDNNKYLSIGKKGSACWLFCEGSDIIELYDKSQFETFRKRYNWDNHSTLIE